MHEGHVDVAGATLRFEVHGEGPPLVLVHPTGGSALAMAPMLPVLTRTHSVVLPELHGTMSAEDGGRPCTIDDLAAGVVAIADQAGLERFDLAGYSLGGAVALAVAADHQRRVRTLVPMFSWARSTPELVQRFDLWVRLFRSDPSLFMAYLFDVGGTPEWLATSGPALDQVIAAFSLLLAPGTDRHALVDRDLDLTDRLGAITAPTRVVVGRRDRVLPPEHGRAVADGIEGATVLEVDGNHLWPVEEPDRAAEVLVECLSTDGTP